MVLGLNPPKVGDVCQLPLSLRYSQPDTELRVIVVAVLSARVGGGGVVCVAFVTVAVGFDVTSPVQLAAVTVTVVVLPMSSCTSV